MRKFFLYSVLAGSIIGSLLTGQKKQSVINDANLSVRASFFPDNKNDEPYVSKKSKAECNAVIGFPDGTSKKISVSDYIDYSWNDIVILYDTKGHAYKTDFSNVVLYD